MTNQETRLRDRRCRCGKSAAELDRQCAWHDSVSAEYARDLHAALFEETTSLMRNAAGEWVPAVPLPYYGIVYKICGACDERFWTMAGYRGHYALVHVLERGREVRKAAS